MLDLRFSVLNYLNAYSSFRKKKMLPRSVAMIISCTFGSCVYIYSEKDLVSLGWCFTYVICMLLND